MASASLACTVNRHTQDPLRSAPAPMRVEPALALSRAMISSAFHDAKRCAHGVPTTIAMDAVCWLLEDAPSKYVTPPGSFAWCCSWLGFDRETIRQRGLPEVRSVYLAGADHTRGLDEVFSVWAAHRAAYLAAGGHDERTETSDRKARARVQRVCGRHRARTPQDAPTPLGEVTRPRGSTAGSVITMTRVRPSLRAIGHDVAARYEAYATYCRCFIGISPMVPQLWRLYAG
jgi:hypothetical protein